jgi:autonomous glycyl radical cofactor GrcA
MSTENLNSTSVEIENFSQINEAPQRVNVDVLKQRLLEEKKKEIENFSQNTEAPQRVNVDVLKQRLLEEKKKEKVKRTIIVSSVVASLLVLTSLIY